jgi:hypothetical protein
MGSLCNDAAHEGDLFAVVRDLGRSVPVDQIGPVARRALWFQIRLGVLNLYFMLGDPFLVRADRLLNLWDSAVLESPVKPVVASARQPQKPTAPPFQA